MTTATAEHAGRAGGRSLVDRFLASIPLIALVLAFIVFYGVEAWTRRTPWIFSDELEWTQISRSIAATGHAARRGQPIYFKSVYAYLIAPFWWFKSTATAYAAIKYANSLMMLSTAIPTYLLGRMLVTRRAALVVAVGSVAVPAMAYATSIVTDVLAYPYFALCSWLSVRALKSGRRRDVVLAIVFALGGYFVRETQFSTIPMTLGIAAFGLWLTGPRGRHLRRNWTTGDKIGAIALAVGAFFLFNRVVLQHVQEWQIPSQYFKNRIVDLGLKAGLSLTIGLGILPVIGGLTSLRLPERRGDATYRAYAAWTASAIGVFGLYTAVKATSLSLGFATRWEERDLIYLSPLLLLGTAMVFEAKKIDWRVVAAASTFVAVMIAFKEIQWLFPYYDSPGESLVALLHDNSHWSSASVHVLLIAVFAVSIGLIALRRRRWAAPVAIVLLLGWMLAGEIAMTYGLDQGADAYVNNLPKPLNWVDIGSHGQPVTYLGQAIVDPNGENLTEFWNRSVHFVTSLDGTAPGPGPATTPNLVNASGLLDDTTGTHYVLADIGVVLDGKVVARGGDMTLYKINGPWHLLDAVQAVDTDSWCQKWCSYTYFKPHQSGTLVIDIGRQGYKGLGEAGRATLSIGPVLVEKSGAIQLKNVAQRIHRLVQNGQPGVVRVHIAQTPVRVEIAIPNTLPHKYTGDPRNLGAQVGFTFVPDKGQ